MKQKRYSNLLEDEADEIIENLESNRKELLRTAVFLSIALVFVAILCIQLKFDNIKLSKQENVELVLTEKLLEQNIGEAILYPSKEINDSILYDYLVEINAWYPEVLLAQAKLESANYESNIFKKTNNLYGMKSVNSRMHCQTGSYNSYGLYDSWKLSVIDRVLWDLFAFKEKPDIESYISKLEIYAEDTVYIKKIKQLASNVSNDTTIQYMLY